VEKHGFLGAPLWKTAPLATLADKKKPPRAAVLAAREG